MVYARQLGSIFSTDPELLDLYQEVGGPLAAMMVTFGMACFLERVPMAMGQAKVVMYLGLIGSWLGQVPGVHTAIDAFALLYNHTGASGACSEISTVYWMYNIYRFMQCAPKPLRVFSA